MKLMLQTSIILPVVISFISILISCQSPIKSNQSVKIKKTDSTTLFYGSWIQPNPINEKEVQGFILKADSLAESINMHTLLYRKWWWHNHKLYLVSESIGNTVSSTDTTAYEVIKINQRELQLKDRELLLQYTKQP